MAARQQGTGRAQRPGRSAGRVVVATILLALFPGFVPRADAPDRIESVGVTGTAFEVRLASGKVLAGADLKGATLRLVVPGAQTPQKVRIDDVLVDPMDPEHERLVYRMSAIDPSTGAATELCDPDPQGQRFAFPLQGQWDSEGYRISDQGFTLTCSSGAQGKCVRFGYPPWKTLPDGTKLAEYHQACVRMVRADYCGNRGTTRDGMLIDYYDRLGIAKPDPDAPAQGLRFEAAWTPTGAACVAHTRVPEHITLEQLETACPRLRGRLGPQACTPATLDKDGRSVLLYNLSR